MADFRDVDCMQNELKFVSNQETTAVHFYIPQLYMLHKSCTALEDLTQLSGRPLHLDLCERSPSLHAMQCRSDASKSTADPRRMLQVLQLHLKEHKLLQAGAFVAASLLQVHGIMPALRCSAHRLSCMGP